LNAKQVAKRLSVLIAIAIWVRVAKLDSASSVASACDRADWSGPPSGPGGRLGAGGWPGGAPGGSTMKIVETVKVSASMRLLGRCRRSSVSTLVGEKASTSRASAMAVVPTVTMRGRAVSETIVSDSTDALKSRMPSTASSATSRFAFRLLVNS